MSLLTAAAVGVAVSAIAAPAEAITFNLGGTSVAGEGIKSSVAGASTIDFNSAPLGSSNGYSSGIASFSGQGSIVNGSVSGRYAAPPDDLTNYLSLGSSQEPGPVSIKFGNTLNYLGLFAGSIDSFNKLQFFRNGAFVHEALFAGSGDQSANGAVYVNFFSQGSTDLFDEVRLFSTQAAFEVDNIAYRAIPTPALLPGLVGLGVAALRKRKGEQKAEAEA